MKRMLVLAVVLGGCGDDGGETPIDGATPPDTLVVDTPIDSPPAAQEGQVFLAETDSPISIAIAMFANGPLFPMSATAGPCFTGGTSPATSVDAGTITVTGTASPVVLEQEDPGDVYTPSALAPEELFAPGATLTATTTGGTVPAFTGSVTAPQPLAGLVFPSAFSRSTPPTITWTAGTGTVMWFLFTTDQNAMLCRVPDSGSFALSSAALALLPAAATETTVIVYRLNEATVQAGTWSITLRAADGITSEQTPLAP